MNILKAVKDVHPTQQCKMVSRPDMRGFVISEEGDILYANRSLPFEFTRTCFEADDWVFYPIKED